ncbi:MAG: fused MFS/spermidine synthase [Desulfobacterota bacterium]|nr:fused MFS/spermidine synthase [Thermodesulfobacteriota bacterium]MDW8002245.1 fused MFS/spermidine synthase [Deltaproteobacteria bacterium]
MSLLTAYAITFIASFCTLVIEIVAGRILAPFVGVSIYTWTSIIGVILAGISIGAYIGGRLADKYPSRKTLSVLLLLSGFTALMIIPLTNLVASYKFPLSLMMRIFVVTSIIFFIPSCILGTISPVVIRLALKNVESAGGIVGKIYAFSTLGAIIGTYVTGFFLISWMGTRNIIFTTGLILLVSALFVGSLFRRKVYTVSFFVLLVPVLALCYESLYKVKLREDTYFYKESDYYTIKLCKSLSSDGKTELDALILDNLIHSYVCKKDPTHIEYEYERIYADVLKWKYKKKDNFKTLTIGGGGYTFPRYMEVYYPNAKIDVVEIDPEVTKVAYEHLGLPRNTRIRTFNTDGRWYVMNCKEKYDVVFLDAYNDLTVPYHLTTKEFLTQVNNIMTEDGILLSNIIDNFQKGEFLPSYIHTLKRVFGEEKVFLLSVSPNFEDLRISTFIVIASKGNLNIKEFDRFVKERRLKGKATTVVVPDELVKKMISGRRVITISDDYAPVDNLVAPVFEERFGYDRKDG